MLARRAPITPDLPFQFVGCSSWKSKASATTLIRFPSVSRASQINTKNSAANRRPIKRTKLAAEDEKSEKKFIAVSGTCRFELSPISHNHRQREKLKGHDASHPSCGWGDMSLKNVFLKRIVRVSTASWQPEILLEQQPVVSHAEASSSSSSKTHSPEGS